MAETLRLGSVLVIAAALVLAGCGEGVAQPPGGAQTTTRVEKDVPYVPTPQPVVDRMLEMAGVSGDDVVYDLGSGDGRIVITAASRYGARGVGIDIDPQRIAEANENARDARVTQRVKFIQGNLFEADLRPATAVTLYLLPTVNIKLRPKLLDELRPGTPVVSHDFSMGEWEPDETDRMEHDDIFLWIVPAKVEGSWQLGDGSGRTFTISQLFQKINVESPDGPVTDATLRGDHIEFTVNELRGGRNVARRYTARVSGDTMSGSSRVDGASSQPFTARRGSRS